MNCIQIIKGWFFKIAFILLLINSVAESKAPELISENGFYYVIQPNGGKTAIVAEHEPQAPNIAQVSPDGQYVFYTTANGLGFESEGRDLYYCKIDGTGRTFIHKFELSMDSGI